MERISSIDVTAEKVDGILRNGHEWSLQASSKRKALSTLLCLRCLMKTYRIQLDPVEVAMLHEVQKVNRDYRDLQALVINQIRQEYAKLSKSRQQAAH